MQLVPSDGAVGRRVLLLGAALAAATGGVALLTRPQTPEPAAGTPRPTRHRYGDHPRQVGDLYRPAGASVGTTVMLHGGFWQAAYDLTLQDAVAADLAGRGWTVWNLDYRCVGDGGGFPATFDDVRAGIAHLSRLDVDGDPVVLGHSAGGHLAAWAAGADTGPVRVRAAVPMAGVLDLTTAARQGLGGGAVQSLMGGGPDEVPERYAVGDPVRRLPLDVPVRCVHGVDDTVVPLGQTTAYVAASVEAGGEPATAVETPGGHFDALDPGTAMWRRTVEVLDGLR